MAEAVRPAEAGHAGTGARGASPYGGGKRGGHDLAADPGWDSGSPPDGPPPSDGTPDSDGAADARSASDAAEQPGDEEHSRLQGEIRDAVHEALQTLGPFGTRTSGVQIVAKKVTFRAPVAGGDISTGGKGDGSAALYAVSAHTVTEITKVHVEPRGYAELSAALERDRLLLLLSPARWGSSTTSIKLLSPFGMVHELKFGGALPALPVEELPSKCGFVLEGLTTAQVAGLRERDLPVLAERLTRRGGRLIVIIDPSTRLDHAVRRRAVALQAPPPALDLVTSHLAALVSSSGRAEEFLAEHHLANWLQETAPDSFDAPLLVELARDLAEATEHRATVEDAVSRFRDRSRQDVEAWLDALTDFDQRAIIVSLSVLGRMPYDAVSRAATLLEQAWRSDDAGGGTTPARARRTRTARLRAARARTTRELRSTRYGAAELEIASFVDESYPARLLYHLWHEHDYDRDLIIAWLKTVANDVEGRVRIRAASAIGFLARYAFDTIRREIIVPWAGSGNGDERERAVAALAFPARDPETAARTVRLVLDWSERKTDPLRISAARALGTSVGAVLPDGPDERLTELADKAGPQLAIALGDSIAELLGDAAPARQLELLRLLDEWAGQTRTGRQVAGTWGFLQVAQGLWTEVSTGDEVAHWPTLLWLAAGGAEPAADAATAAAIREVIAQGWGRALLAPRADRAVAQVLRTWAGTAEHTSDLRQALVAFLAEVASTRRLANLLAAHARAWRHHRALAPDLARRLLDALHREDTTR